MATGPTPVPDFVLSAMTESIYYHRGPAFSQVMKDCRELLPAIFGTKNDVLLFSGTGTLAMEGAIANFFNPGEEVISINAGKFGERWSQQAKIYGLKVHEIFVERGKAVEVAAVEEAIKKNKGNIRGILAHASETSTGVRHNIQKIASLAQQENNCLMCVDGVTSLGGFSVPMDKWGVDVLVGGSQKGFMLPPGLSFGAASAKAWKKSDEVKNVRYYMDWRKERKANAEFSGAFTSVVSLIGGLRSVLKYFHEVGLDNIYKRSWKLTYATRNAFRAMGCELFVKDDSQVSSACTAVMADGPYPKLIREQYGLTMSGGQDELKGKILRIGHIGYLDAWDVLDQLLAFGQVSASQGKPINMEAGLTAFWKTVHSTEDLTPKDLKDA